MAQSVLLHNGQVDLELKARDAHSTESGSDEKQCESGTSVNGTLANDPIT